MEGGRTNKCLFSAVPHSYHQRRTPCPLADPLPKNPLTHPPKHNAMHIIAANPSTGASRNLTSDDNNAFTLTSTSTNDTTIEPNKVPW